MRTFTQNTFQNALGMIGESEDLAASLLSDADMNHDSKIDLDGKKHRKITYYLINELQTIDTI